MSNDIYQQRQFFETQNTFTENLRIAIFHETFCGDRNCWHTKKELTFNGFTDKQNGTTDNNK